MSGSMPDNTIVLLISAQHDPVRMLSTMRDLLDEAIREATIEFDPFAASEITTKVSAVLKVAADELKSRSLETPKPRRRKKKKRIEIVEGDSDVEPASWRAI